MNLLQRLFHIHDWKADENRKIIWWTNGGIGESKSLYKIEQMYICSKCKEEVALKVTVEGKTKIDKDFFLTSLLRDKEK